MSDYSDSGSESDGASDGESINQPIPLSNPPNGHKLYTHKYDTFSSLMDDLQDYTAKVGLSVRILQSNNKHKELGYTRYDLTCQQGKL